MVVARWRKTAINERIRVGKEREGQIAGWKRGRWDCRIDIHWARFYGSSLRLLTWIAGEVRRKIRGTLFWWSTLYNVTTALGQTPIMRFSCDKRYIGDVEEKMNLIIISKKIKYVPFIKLLLSIFLFVLIIISFNKCFYKDCKFMFVYLEVSRDIYINNNSTIKSFPWIKKYKKFFK